MNCCGWSATVEGAIGEHRGMLVKRLGDGLMAVFVDPEPAVAPRSTPTEWAGSRSRGTAQDAGGGALRPAAHIGGDYLGVDVNVAARVAGQASGGGARFGGSRERLDESSLRVKRRRFFRAKGAPSDLRVFAVARNR